MPRKVRRANAGLMWVFRLLEPSSAGRSLGRNPYDETEAQERHKVSRGPGRRRQVAAEFLDRPNRTMPKTASTTRYKMRDVPLRYFHASLKLPWLATLMREWLGGSETARGEAHPLAPDPVGSLGFHCSCQGHYDLRIHSTGPSVAVMR